MQKIPQDWKDLLELLKSSGVEFLVVGAYALAAHGHERYTKDLDIWLSPTAVTAKVVTDMLTTFGFPDLAVTADEWTGGASMVQMGREPYRIVFMNFASGLDFDDAYAKRIFGNLGGTEVSCLSRESLITNKLASGRLQDFADVEAIAPERIEDIRAAMAKKFNLDKF